MLNTRHRHFFANCLRRTRNRKKPWPIGNEFLDQHFRDRRIVIAGVPKHIEQVAAQNKRQQTSQHEPDLGDGRRNDRRTVSLVGNLSTFVREILALPVDALTLGLNRRLRVSLKLGQLLSALCVAVDQILLNLNKLTAGFRLGFYQFALQFDHVFSRISARLDELVCGLSDLLTLIRDSLILPGLAVAGLLPKLDQTIVRRTTPDHDQQEKDHQQSRTT
jgi:hypothetical protein